MNHKSEKFPSRILFLGKGDDDMRLVDQIKSKGKSSYAALSHCWGEHQPFKAVQSNLNELMKQVPWTQLPPVFQDAIKVCRRLQIGYLWIDSLCILQDSKDDWEVESAKMSDYYENSTLTICVASSNNGSEAFLMERNKRWLPHVYDLVDPTQLQCSIVAREHPRAERKEDNEKLMTRAWAWQEAVLSTRTVVYAASGITWVCRSECVAEDGSDGLRVDTHHMAMGISEDSQIPGAREVAILPAITEDVQTSSQIHEDESSAEIMESWWRLVRSFSARSLTYETDRLPAISGVASRVQKKLDCRYLAGLWEDQLVESLCWFKDTGQGPSWFPPVEYIAPSWSWASVIGVENYATRRGMRFTRSAEILEAQCDVPGFNPFGKVSTGYILVKGKARLVPILCGDTTDWWQYELGLRKWKLSKFSWVEYRMLKEKESLRVDGALTVRNEIICRAQRVTKGKRISGLVYALLLGHGGKSEESSEERFYALLLGGSETGDDLTRVGLLEMTDGRLFEDAEEETFRVV